MLIFYYSLALLTSFTNLLMDLCFLFYSISEICKISYLLVDVGWVSLISMLTIEKRFFSNTLAGLFEGFSIYFLRSSTIFSFLFEFSTISFFSCLCSFSLIVITSSSVYISSLLSKYSMVYFFGAACDFIFFINRSSYCSRYYWIVFYFCILRIYLGEQNSSVSTEELSSSSSVESISKKCFVLLSPTGYLLLNPLLFLPSTSSSWP